VESLIPLVLVFLFMWFLLIRPQQQRVRAQRSMLQALAVGDEVVTAGGICGRIVEMNDEQVTLQVDDGVQIRFVRPAIRQRVAAETPDTDGPLGEDEA
jgi:preprotein translocase subunit YajC